jgi:hypothetical protein
MLALQIILELIGSVIVVFISFNFIRMIVVDWAKEYEQKKVKEKEKTKRKSFSNKK